MNLGDFALGQTVDFKFTTRDATGAPAALTGGTVAAYVGNGTTEITAGITLTASFDSRTGLNHVRVVATAANGYAAGTDVDLILTAGTVDSISVAGENLRSFSIENRYIPGVIATGTAQAGGAATIQLAAATSFADDIVDSAVLFIKRGTGFGQSRLVTDWVSSTDTATVSPAWTTVPDATSVYDVYAAPPSTTTNLPDVNVASMSTDVLTAAAILNGAFTEVKFQDGFITGAKFAAPTAPVAVLGIIAAGTAQSGTSSTIRLASATAFSDDLVNAATVVITGGTGVGQARLITDYVSSTDTATVSPAWGTSPDNTSTYVAFATAPTVTTVLPDVNVASVNTDAISAVAVSAAAVTKIQAGLALASALSTAAAAVTLIKAVTDKVDTMVELDGVVYRLTLNAVELAPTGGSAPTAAVIASTVLDKALSAHVIAGSVGAGITAAQSAGDPLSTALPGSYAAGTAGAKINAIDAKVAGLTYTVANMVDSNVQLVNDETVAGTGAAGDRWRKT